MFSGGEKKTFLYSHYHDNSAIRTYLFSPDYTLSEWQGFLFFRVKVSFLFVGLVKLA